MVSATVGAVLGESPAGTVDLVLATPGRTPDGCTVSAAVLRRDAGRLAGAPVWMGADSPARRRLRDGMPRPVSELAGEIREAWWDAARGAVVGRASLTEQAASLVRRLPGAIRVALQGAFRSRAGSRIVEALESDVEQMSVELVTRGSAATGGPVNTMREAAVTGRGMTLREALGTPEVREYIAEMVRPAVRVRAVAPPDPAAEYRQALARGDFHRGGARQPLGLQEAALRGAPVCSEQPGHGSFSEACRARGMDPAAFGLGGDAA